VHRLLLTGVSGTGKSALVSELQAGGHLAIDLDCVEYSQWVDVHDATTAAGSPVAPGRDWVWREDAVRDLLAVEHGDALFVSGCAANMDRFLPCFDHVVLLSAPADVIAARLVARPRGEYGNRPEEVARTVALIETVEPLLRRAADQEIDTSGSVERAAAAVLAIAQAACARGAAVRTPNSRCAVAPPVLLTPGGRQATGTPAARDRTSVTAAERRL
jgi:broad-specificity NMP kinase